MKPRGALLSRQESRGRHIPGSRRHQGQHHGGSHHHTLGTRRRHQHRKSEWRRTAYQAAFREVASSGKTGDGMAFACAAVKFWDNDMTGWTSEMLAARPELASNMAVRLNATPTFKAEVWEVVKTRIAHGWAPPSSKPTGARFPRPRRSRPPRSRRISCSPFRRVMRLPMPGSRKSPPTSSPSNSTSEP